VDIFHTIDNLKSNLLQEFHSKHLDKFDHIISKFIFSGFSNFNRELSLILNNKKSMVYSVSGPFSLRFNYKKPKVYAWVFRQPTQPQSLFSPYHPDNLLKHSGFICLTPKAENYFSQFAPAKFIPWAVDLDFFDGRSPKQKPKIPFFLATGKTGRDYRTLIKAAYLVDSEIRIIGPSIQKPKILPSNVTWIDTSSDPPDQAIDYATLREWYAQCTAVCIPLSGDADDTCGYTNMLEAMAMCKPVLMTQSGCLHINAETDGFGIQIKPRDAQGWTQAMKHLHEDHEKALEMGNRGRGIVEQDFTIERFNHDVLEFIETILNER
jgi:glycosyltransferase involved in cell wall biosynthesis